MEEGGKEAPLNCIVDGGSCCLHKLAREEERGRGRSNFDHLLLCTLATMQLHTYPKEVSRQIRYIDGGDTPITYSLGAAAIAHFTPGQTGGMKIES